jgi:hypothetical protein
VKFIKQAITSYTSTQIAQEYPTWLIGSTYAIGDIVMWGNYFWKNSFTANIGHEPSDDSVYWVKWGTSNYYSLIDTQSTTMTTVATDLAVTFPIGNIDSLVLGYYTAVSVKIENLDDANNVLRTETFTQSFNDEVFDYWDYIYSDYTLTTQRANYFYIYRMGTKIRVTFTKGSMATVSCGYMIGGRAIYMGQTKDNVKIGWHSYSTRNTDQFGILSITKRSAQDLVDFETSIPSDKMMVLRRKAKTYRDEVVAFVVDESSTSIYENIVVLGVMQDMQPIASSFDLTTLTWSVLESI